MDDAWERVGGSGAAARAATRAVRSALRRSRAASTRRVARAREDDAPARSLFTSARALARLGRARPGLDAALVADERVRHLHGARLRSKPLPTHLVPSGEQAKTLSVVERLWQRARDSSRSGHDRRARRRLDHGRRRVRRGDVPARRSLDRGADDARRPGRCGDRRQDRINLPRQEPRRRLPLAAAACPSTRRCSRRCPRRSGASGMAEVVKTGLLAGEQLWELPDDELVRALRRVQGRGLSSAIRTSAGRARAILNLGHTFAHALEAGVRLRRCRTATRSRSACSRRFACRAATDGRVEEMLAPGAGPRRPRPRLGCAPPRQEGAAATRLVLLGRRRPARSRAFPKPTCARALDELIAD